MIKQKRKTKMRTWVISLLLAALCALGMFGRVFIGRAEDSSASKQYTDVMTDLSKDHDFDISAYPEKDGSQADDYKIDVIQIAESTDRELYMYCYIPCLQVSSPSGDKIDLSPTEVSLAVSSDITELKYLLHGLTEVSRYKTLVKYVVRGVEVNTSDPTRYYSVSMLQRKWSKYVPGETEDKATKPEPVGKLWTVTNVDDGVKYEERHKDTIEILNPIAGAVRYAKDQVPANWGVDAVDSHFIAFDTDLPIDDLLEADVSYIPIAWISNAAGGNGHVGVNNTYAHVYAEHIKYDGSDSDMAYALNEFRHSADGVPGSISIPNAAALYTAYEENMTEYVRGQAPTTVTIKKDEQYTFDTGGWTSSDKYTWNRIQDLDGFKSSLQDKNIVNMSGTYTTEDIEKRTWFLRYRETPWDDPDSPDEAMWDLGEYECTRDLDIIVLRLKFETAGQVYDLGTVSYKVDQSEYIEGNTPKTFWQALLDWFEENWWVLIVVLIGVVLLIVLAPFLPTIFSAIVSFLQMLLKGLWWLAKHLCLLLWWIVSLPFRAIAALVRKIKGTDE